MSKKIPNIKRLQTDILTYICYSFYKLIKMFSSKIIGLGHYVPKNIVTNDDLSKVMDTTDQWIQERTGIKE